MPELNKYALHCEQCRAAGVFLIDEAVDGVRPFNFLGVTLRAKMTHPSAELVVDETGTESFWVYWYDAEIALVLCSVCKRNHAKNDLEIAREIRQRYATEEPPSFDESLFADIRHGDYVALVGPHGVYIGLAEDSTEAVFKFLNFTGDRYVLESIMKHAVKGIVKIIGGERSALFTLKSQGMPIKEVVEYLTGAVLYE